MSVPGTGSPATGGTRDEVGGRQSSRAVLHDIRYSRFSGQLRSRASSVADLVRTDVMRPLGLRRSAGAKVWPFLLLAAAYLPALAVVAVPLLVPGVPLEPLEMLSYSALLATDTMVLLAFVATTVPSLLTRDRRDRVLSLYFATALSPGEYVLGKALAALSLVLIIVLGPLLVLFGGSVISADAPGEWLAEHAGDLPRLVGAALVVGGFHAVLGLLVGSLTSRRVFAVGGYLAVVLVGPALAVLLANVLGDDGWLGLDPASGPMRLATRVLGDPMEGSGALAWGMWGVVVGGGSLGLWLRYRGGRDS
ncbi:ABC-2 type transport system permease protein [Kineococcus xinjiangensis]|uniref:ABC-2 type transport system permease protein n=1 Tax=Kineococcus xinjiangensis TaxID=512762 RepID=A0A2S6IUC5_9ACTN|nr:ABC transporter permease [Kineococcus xinjiangensis]PPK97656.1 ABC-2 type transport system permease protein [Kineococcus xinjiangensis]